MAGVGTVVAMVSLGVAREYRAIIAHAPGAAAGLTSSPAMVPPLSQGDVDSCVRGNDERQPLPLYVVERKPGVMHGTATLPVRPSRLARLQSQ